MDLFLKFLILGGKYLTQLTAQSIVEAYRRSLQLGRSLNLHAERAMRVVGSHENVLEMYMKNLDEFADLPNAHLAFISEHHRQEFEYFTRDAGLCSDACMAALLEQSASEGFGLQQMATSILDTCIKTQTRNHSQAPVDPPPEVPPLELDCNEQEAELVCTSQSHSKLIVYDQTRADPSPRTVTVNAINMLKGQDVPIEQDTTVSSVAEYLDRQASYIQHANDTFKQLQVDIANKYQQMRDQQYEHEQELARDRDFVQKLKAVQIEVEACTKLMKKAQDHFDVVEEDQKHKRLFSSIDKIIQDVQAITLLMQTNEEQFRKTEDQLKSLKLKDELLETEYLGALDVGSDQYNKNICNMLSQQIRIFTDASRLVQSPRAIMGPLVPIENTIQTFLASDKSKEAEKLMEVNQKAFEKMENMLNYPLIGRWNNHLKKSRKSVNSGRKKEKDKKLKRKREKYPLVKKPFKGSKSMIRSRLLCMLNGSSKDELRSCLCSGVKSTWSTDIDRSASRMSSSLMGTTKDPSTRQRFIHESGLDVEDVPASRQALMVDERLDELVEQLLDNMQPVYRADEVKAADASDWRPSNGPNMQFDENTVRKIKGEIDDVMKCVREKRTSKQKELIAFDLPVLNPQICTINYEDDDPKIAEEPLTASAATPMLFDGTPVEADTSDFESAMVDFKSKVVRHSIKQTHTQNEVESNRSLNAESIWNPDQVLDVDEVVDKVVTNVDRSENSPAHNKTKNAQKIIKSSDMQLPSLDHLSTRAVHSTGLAQETISAKITDVDESRVKRMEVPMLKNIPVSIKSDSDRVCNDVVSVKGIFNESASNCSPLLTTPPVTEKKTFKVPFVVPLPEADSVSNKSNEVYGLCAETVYNVVEDQNSNKELEIDIVSNDIPNISFRIMVPSAGNTINSAPVSAEPAHGIDTSAVMNAIAEEIHEKQSISEWKQNNPLLQLALQMNEAAAIKNKQMEEQNRAGEKLKKILNDRPDVQVGNAKLSKKCKLENGDYYRFSGFNDSKASELPPRRRSVPNVGGRQKWGGTMKKSKRGSKSYTVVKTKSNEITLYDMINGGSRMGMSNDKLVGTRQMCISKTADAFKRLKPTKAKTTWRHQSKDIKLIPMMLFSKKCDNRAPGSVELMGSDSKVAEPMKRKPAAMQEILQIQKQKLLQEKVDEQKSESIAIEDVKSEEVPIVDEHIRVHQMNSSNKIQAIRNAYNDSLKAKYTIDSVSQKSASLYNPRKRKLSDTTLSDRNSTIPKTTHTVVPRATTFEKPPTGRLVRRDVPMIELSRFQSSSELNSAPTTSKLQETRVPKHEKLQTLHIKMPDDSSELTLGSKSEETIKSSATQQTKDSKEECSVFVCATPSSVTEETRYRKPKWQDEQSEIIESSPIMATQANNPRANDEDVVCGYDVKYTHQKPDVHIPRELGKPVDPVIREAVESYHKNFTEQNIKRGPMQNLTCDFDKKSLDDRSSLSITLESSSDPAKSDLISINESSKITSKRITNVQTRNQSSHSENHLASSMPTDCCKAVQLPSLSMFVDDDDPATDASIVFPNTKLSPTLSDVRELNECDCRNSEIERVFMEKNVPLNVKSSSFNKPASTAHKHIDDAVLDYEATRLTPRQMKSSEVPTRYRPPDRPQTSESPKFPEGKQNTRISQELRSQPQSAKSNDEERIRSNISKMRNLNKIRKASRRLTEALSGPAISRTKSIDECKLASKVNNMPRPDPGHSTVKAERVSSERKERSPFADRKLDCTPKQTEERAPKYSIDHVGETYQTAPKRFEPNVSEPYVAPITKYSSSDKVAPNSMGQMPTQNWQSVKSTAPEETTTSTMKPHADEVLRKQAATVISCRADDALPKSSTRPPSPPPPPKCQMPKAASPGHSALPSSREARPASRPPSGQTSRPPSGQISPSPRMQVTTPSSAKCTIESYRASGTPTAISIDDTVTVYPARDPSPPINRPDINLVHQAKPVYVRTSTRSAEQQKERAKPTSHKTAPNEEVPEMPVSPRQNVDTYMASPDLSSLGTNIPLETSESKEEQLQEFLSENFANRRKLQLQNKSATHLRSPSIPRVKDPEPITPVAKEANQEIKQDVKQSMQKIQVRSGNKESESRTVIRVNLHNKPKLTTPPMSSPRLKKDSPLATAIKSSRVQFQSKDGSDNLGANYLNKFPHERSLYSKKIRITFPSLAGVPTAENADSKPGEETHNAPAAQQNMNENVTAKPEQAQRIVFKPPPISWGTVPKPPTYQQIEKNRPKTPLPSVPVTSPKDVNTMQSVPVPSSKDTNRVMEAKFSAVPIVPTQEKDKVVEQKPPKQRPRMNLKLPRIKWGNIPKVPTFVDVYGKNPSIKSNTFNDAAPDTPAIPATESNANVQTGPPVTELYNRQKDEGLANYRLQAKPVKMDIPQQNRENFTQLRPTTPASTPTRPETLPRHYNKENVFNHSGTSPIEVSIEFQRGSSPHKELPNYRMSATNLANYKDGERHFKVQAKPVKTDLHKPSREKINFRPPTTPVAPDQIKAERIDKQPRMQVQRQSREKEYASKPRSSLASQSEMRIRKPQETPNSARSPTKHNEPKSTKPVSPILSRPIVDLRKLELDTIRSGSNVQYLMELSSNINNTAYNKLLAKCYPEEKKQIDESRQASAQQKMAEARTPTPPKIPANKTTEQSHGGTPHSALPKNQLYGYKYENTKENFIDVQKMTTRPVIKTLSKLVQGNLKDKQPAIHTPPVTPRTREEVKQDVSKIKLELHKNPQERVTSDMRLKSSERERNLKRLIIMEDKLKKLESQHSRRADNNGAVKNTLNLMLEDYRIKKDYRFTDSNLRHSAATGSYRKSNVNTTNDEVSTKARESMRRMNSSPIDCTPPASRPNSGKMAYSKSANITKRPMRARDKTPRTPIPDLNASSRPSSFNIGRGDEVHSAKGPWKLPLSRKKNLLPNVPELKNMELVTPKAVGLRMQAKSPVKTEDINPPPFRERSPVPINYSDEPHIAGLDSVNRRSDKYGADEKLPTLPPASKPFMPYALKYQGALREHEDSIIKNTQFDEQKTKDLKFFQGKVKKIQETDYKYKQVKLKPLSVAKKEIHPYTNTFGRHLVRLQTESDRNSKMNTEEYQKALEEKLQKLSALPRVKHKLECETPAFVYKPPMDKGGIREFKKPSLSEVKRTIIKHLKAATGSSHSFSDETKAHV